MKGVLTMLVTTIKPVVYWQTDTNLSIKEGDRVVLVRAYRGVSDTVEGVIKDMDGRMMTIQTEEGSNKFVMPHQIKRIRVL